MISRIGLDMDGVVYDWINACKAIFKEKLNIPLEHWTGVEGWKNPLWMDNTLPEWEYYHENMYQFFFEGYPYEGALEGINKIHMLTDNLTLLTLCTEEAAEAKLAWLDKYNVDYDEFVVIKQDDLHLSKDKKSDHKCSIYIDDASHHVDDLVENVPDARVILFNQTWNSPIYNLQPNTNEYFRTFGWEDTVSLVKLFHDEQSTLSSA